MLDPTGVNMVRSYLTASIPLVTEPVPSPPYLVILDWFIIAAALSGIVWIGLRRRHPPAVRSESLGDVTAFREDAILIPVIVYLATVLAFSACLKPDGVADSTRHGWINGVAQAIGGAVCLRMGASRYPGGARALLLGARTGATTGRLFALLAGAVVAWAICPLIHRGTVYLILRFDPAFALEPHATLRALRDGKAPIPVVIGLWMGAAMIAPAAEELFFRGMLQNTLLNLTRSHRLAVALAAVAFGSVHASQPDAIPALIFFGLLLGYAYRRTGSLLVPVAIHAAFNLKTLLWETLLRAGWA